MQVFTGILVLLLAGVSWLCYTYAKHMESVSKMIYSDLESERAAFLSLKKEYEDYKKEIIDKL